MPFPDVIDNTIRKAFVGCGQRAKRRFIDELAPVGKRSVDLHFGACFASGLEVARNKFYFDGKSAEEAMNGATALALSLYGDFVPPAFSAKTKTKLEGALRYYFEQWPLGEDGLTPVADGIERSFSFELPLRHPDTGANLLFAGRYDMLATDTNGRLHIVDEKTAGKIADAWVGQWDLDAQTTGYIFGTRETHAGWDVDVQAQIRGISVAGREFGHVEIPIVRPSWMLQRWYGQLLRDVGRMVGAYRTGEWDYALDGTCMEYGRKCDYTQLCLSPNPERLIDGNYVHAEWHPLTRQF